MHLKLDLQRASVLTGLPDDGAFERWVQAALEGRREHAELTIRMVNAAESASLNQTYRGRPGPTNVLSFPFDAPAGVPMGDSIHDLLGDLVICADVVAREAQEQEKSAEAHWAHLVVHGVLHLLGHDHQDEADAVVMEDLETRILDALGFPSPYEEP
ncbi:rRNA maturation RNase YbeY [Thiocapsa imhoffii]|uniref:Endoribonuclease YbeY n=1 Tax=Thiocapsa imhoffii TaxID=382777 RepID=A0A9X1B8L4_9GAMM|nr:rRNA maturation RNase YbeY [Thiocapsa imhoffii]MBK1644091.1 rRNA maturation RNase YbeY [Thiocapsa imhoffii]